MTTTLTTTTKEDDGYIVQRATRIVTVFNEHLAANCSHCKNMLREIYHSDN